MNNSRRQATIKQVAQEAGVSTQTISRVLNNRPDVASETRKRVQAVIDRLGYRPSAVARSLIQRRSHILGVALAEVAQYGPMRRLLGMEQAANELGYSLHLNLVHQLEKIADGWQIINELVTWHVDGIIWAVPEIGLNRDWFNDTASQFSVPIVFVGGGQRNHLNAGMVSVDNRAGGRLAAQHLLEQGYQHIGMISGPMLWSEAQERSMGWQDIFPSMESRQVFEGDWSSASGERGLRQLLKQYPELDAVFAANDQMALGVLQAAHQLGLRVPEDLGVVGFDNTPESAYYWPPLTTIKHQLFNQGKLMVRDLVDRIEMKQTDQLDVADDSGVLQPELIIRNSSVR